MKDIFFIVVIFLLSCGSNTTVEGDTGETTHANSKDTIVTITPVNLTGCYQMTMKNDSGWLNITVNDSMVNGSLNYNLYEKDSNRGSIKGVVRGNMIYADYMFQSEGTTSTREVIFRIAGDTLMQAFGDLSEKDGKIVFTNTKDLQYLTNSPFIKVICQ